MRKLTRKQLLARLFVGFFTLGSMLCTVNSAVAGGPSETYGEYKINNSVWSPFYSEIKPGGSGNSVEVTVSGQSDQTTPKIYGGYSGSEAINVSSNTVFIKPSDEATEPVSKLDTVYGGYVATGSATQNIVAIASSTVGYVYGGYAGEGNATQNIVNIASSTISGFVSGSVFGGYVNGTGSATQNIVNIASSTVTGYVYGGYVYYSGSATENVVDIASSKINGFIYGGCVDGTGSATQNIVDIASSTVTGGVYGGYVQGTGSATQNIVNIASSTLKYFETTNNVYGGYTDNGNVLENKVNIASSTLIYSGTSITRYVYGGYTNNGSATQNIVDIASSTVKYNVYGGYTNKGNVLENKVNIASSTLIDSVDKNYVYGGYVKENGDVVSNNVTIKDSEVNKTVYGGYVGTGSANLNEVHIASSTVRSVWSGYAKEGNAVSNSVAIASSTVKSEVSGGYAKEGNAASNSVAIASSNVTGAVYGGNVVTGNAASNSVAIAGSTVNNNVYGGIVTGSSNNSALENKVEISSGTVNGSVYGGKLNNGNADSNEVKIASSNVKSVVYGGYVGGTGSATQNIVDIASSTIGSSESSTNNYVYGGYVKYGDVISNKVIIKDSEVNKIVSGGYASSTGSATQNIVDISSSTVKDNVYGGYVGGTGSANSNTVTIKDSIASDSTIYGGYAYNGDANSNTVEITNSKAGTVWGGYIMSESATDKTTNSNTLKLTNSEVYGNIIAANNYGSGNAKQNTIEISGRTIIGSQIAGADVGTGSAISNKVTLSGCSSVTCGQIYGGFVRRGDNGKAYSNAVAIENLEKLDVSQQVAGGRAASGEAASNTVTIKNSTINGDSFIFGGYVDGTGSATLNVVNISSSTVNGVCGGIVDSGSAAENKVYISSSTTGNVIGGEASTGSANLNEVYIDNSIVSNVFGGNVNTSDANLANALENKVYITSSTVNENVYGGYVWTVLDGSTGSANQNEVHITSSTVTGSVYGGYVDGNGNATDNTVEISGGSEVTGSVYGGDATGDARTDNKLIISGTGNKIGGSVKNFESVSFKLASDDDTTKPMLSIDDSMDLNQIKLNSELPKGGFNGERTLIDGNTLNYATATYTINGTAVDGDKSLTVTQKNEGSVNVGVYKYALTESAIKLNAESTIAAVLQQSGKDPLSTDDRKIVVTSEMANNYSRIYGAFNADGGDATGATVELSEAVSNENLTIYGGYSTGSGVDVIKGNTLKVLKNGNKINDILNFSNLDFSLDSDNSNNPTMLALAADTVDLSKTSINVNLTNALAEGQTVTLLGAAQQLNLSDDKLTIDGKALGSDLSLNIAKKVEEKYVNVGGYSLEKDTSKLSIKAKNAVLTSRYRNGAENLSVEKFVLTDELNKNKFKAIYGSYSADNSAAEGGKLFINEAVNLSETTLIGGKSVGNGEVKNNSLEISSAAAGSKVKGAEKFDNFKFTLAAGMSGSTPMLSTTDKILLDGATIDTDLSNLDAADDTKLVLLDNTEGKAAKHLLNGKEGNIINAKKNESFVAISSVGYSDDENKLAIDVKSEAAGSFINEKGELVGNKDKKLVLGSSAASNMRAGFSRASEAPDMSGYKDIYGIYSAGSANPTGATIEIVSAIDYSNSVLHGGYKAAERAFYAEGNTLRVKSLNSKVKGITDFETMEFDLPAETKNGDTMLKVTEAVDMEPTKTVAVEASKATGLKAGDSVNLIASDEGIKNFGTQEVTLSDLTDKTGEVKVDGKALVLALDKNGEKPNDNTKAPVEGISATMALVSQAGNLVSEKLDKSMTSAAANGNGEAETFAAMGGGHEKYETGSYVEADSWNIGFGLAKKGLSKKNPDTTYGLFFQYGKSSFDTHNDGGYRGDGDSKMFGAGLMFHQEARSKYYYQGSISAGKVDADWRSKDGSYDDKATYYGMTFGMGRKHNAGGNKTMDIYGRYSFNHVGSMNGDLNGLKYSFDSTDSHNLRFGFRMEYAKKNSATAYWGLAWEHEFAGDSTATVATLGRTESPTLKGDSGIAEVGYQWKRGDWDYNINAEGSFGKREGVTGSFNINYNF